MDKKTVIRTTLIGTIAGALVAGLSKVIADRNTRRIMGESYLRIREEKARRRVNPIHSFLMRPDILHSITDDNRTLTLEDVGDVKNKLHRHLEGAPAASIAVTVDGQLTRIYFMIANEPSLGLLRYNVVEGRVSTTDPGHECLVQHALKKAMR